MSEELRSAFLEDLAVVRDDAARHAREALTSERSMRVEQSGVFHRLSSVLDSPEDIEAFALAVQEVVHVALHSTLVAIDGGSASAEVGRVWLVGEDGQSLGEGLHELFIDHLFGTGRME